MHFIVNSIFALSATHCVLYDVSYLLERELSQLPSFQGSTLVAASVLLLWVMLRDRRRGKQS